MITREKNWRNAIALAPGVGIVFALYVVVVTVLARSRRRTVLLATIGFMPEMWGLRYWVVDLNTATMGVGNPSALHSGIAMVGAALACLLVVNGGLSFARRRSGRGRVRALAQRVEDAVLAMWAVFGVVSTWAAGWAGARLHGVAPNVSRARLLSQWTAHDCTVLVIGLAAALFVALFSIQLGPGEVPGTWVAAVGESA